MAHIDLTGFVRHGAPFAGLTAVVTALRDAISLRQVAEAAMARGETGDVLRRTMLRELKAQG